MGAEAMAAIRGVPIGSQVYVCRDCRFVFGDRRPQPCPVCRGTDFDDLTMG